VGPVIADVILAELGDWRRFHSQPEVTSYAGLAPGIRESAGKAKQLGITKEGSRLLRWVMIEFAWRMVGASRKWGRALPSLGSPRRREEGDRGDRSPPLGYDLRAAQNGSEICAGPGESTTGILPEQIARDTNPSDPARLRGQPRQASSLGAGAYYGGPLPVPETK
jgi:hypothetical protein